MSGLYNMVFGHNEKAPALLKVLSIDPASVPRLRDVYLTVVDGQPQIVIHTRTGGGNREEYEIQNASLAYHPQFVRDEDDSFDSTYADFYYTVPEAYREMVAKFVAEVGPDETPAEKWQKLFAALKEKE